MGNKIVPVEFTMEEVKKQIHHGKQDAKSEIALKREREQLESRPKVRSSSKDPSIRCSNTKKRYANPERQAKYEAQCS
jgi:hypothetical protein